ncbi:MAG: ComEC family competence protein [Prevotella sp.]|jgi:competence protein ComEC|nr:ComEC family competence protein [Prevotella sp.]
MRNPLSKAPFLFLLIPLLIGILLRYFLNVQYLGMASFCVGIAVMLLSYFIPARKQFPWRWLFGAGAACAMMGVGIFTTALRQQFSEFIFPDKAVVYKGIVTDTPQEKAKTTAYRVYLPIEDKQVVCYLQRDSLTNSSLLPGDEFLFYGKIQPFRNMGNPDDFDYVRYMYNQGFAGSVYVQSSSWQATNKVSSSLKFRALRYRQAIMDFYRSLGFDDTEYSILSALTLGYQNDLTDDLKQGFRTTGTVHVLSVSGLHVGIIYLMIASLLGFIRKRAKHYWLKPALIILLLWIYAYITGLPPSVIRASAMLSLFCVSEIFGRKSFSIHTLFIAAFFMLLVNPFSFFDIGFQLSFMSTLSILYLQPKASAMFKIGNKYARNLWQLFTLSLVAQLATFPLCLYYFGTFPVYFFIANLIIVPLVSFIMYAVGGIPVAKLLSVVLPGLSQSFYYLPVKVLQLLVYLMTSLIHFFESLPSALIKDAKISFPDLFLLFATIIGILIFFIYKKPKALTVGLSAVLLLLGTHIYGNIEKKPDTLTVYNNRQSVKIGWNIDDKEYILDSDSLNDSCRYLNLHHTSILILSSGNWRNKQTDKKYMLDNLILTGGNNHSLYSLTQLFSVKNVVLDASLSVYTRLKLSKECQNLNIPCYDVSQSGAFRLIF